MKTTVYDRFRSMLVIVAMGMVLVFASCSGDLPSAPDLVDAQPVQSASKMGDMELNQALAELRRATAPYHDVEKAIADGFFLRIECEEREGEIPVAAVYGNRDRLLDGTIDPSLPEGLLYEPDTNGKLKLVGVELAMPYALWTSEDPPEFFGVPFQREDELGLFGLHVWVWRHNPEGMFAIRNPRVTC